MIDIEKLRKETPSCEQIVHFNNAGASFMATPVFDEVITHLNLEQTIGGYEAAKQEEIKIEAFYLNASKLIGAKPNEIAFMDSSTRAWTSIFYSIDFKKGDNVITGKAEYASNYIAMLQLSQKLGIEIIVIPDNQSGTVDLEKLENAIDSQTRLIALTHIPTSNGLINPADKVGEIAKKHNILYLLDTCQSLGQISVDVKKVQCDFLCATGRKFLRGPRGTGFLYISELAQTLVQPFTLDLHSAKWTSLNKFEERRDAKKFELWEQNISGKLGLSKALEYCHKIGIDNIEKRVKYLANYLREQLNNILNVQILDRGLDKSGIVTFSSSVDADELHDQLQKHKFNTSISHMAYSRLDLESQNLNKVLRASVHYYNTEEEIDLFCECLMKLTKVKTS